MACVSFHDAILGWIGALTGAGEWAHSRLSQARNHSLFGLSNGIVNT
jgi:hypothetical protein